MEVLLPFQGIHNHRRHMCCRDAAVRLKQCHTVLVCLAGVQLPHEGYGVPALRGWPREYGHPGKSLKVVGVSHRQVHRVDCRITKTGSALAATFHPGPHTCGCKDRIYCFHEWFRLKVIGNNKMANLRKDATAIQCRRDLGNYQRRRFWPEPPNAATISHQVKRYWQHSQLGQLRLMRPPRMEIEGVPHPISVVVLDVAHPLVVTSVARVVPPGCRKRVKRVQVESHGILALLGVVHGCLSFACAVACSAICPDLSVHRF
mmetsp:Transcript_3807/g.10967  ORF Transcript_3807/g.10967 Transcript_3807/m.10967 type:complete len:260 (+) Transcript_3807:654-1433(+)